MDFNLLSAEHYHQVYEEPTQTVKAGSPQRQVYQGLLDMDRPPSPPQTRTRGRKGSKKDNSKVSNLDENARQRGRPRVDTKDQTPAERRRTQIRLAQRAYRQRKETTISGLNERVLSLEQIIQDMHKSFLTFQDEAVAAGLGESNPGLAGTLHRAAASFTELAKNGTHQSDAEGEDIEATQVDESGANAGGDILSSRDMRPQLAEQESNSAQQRRQSGVDAGLGTDTIWGYSPKYQHLLIASDSQNQQQESAQEVEDASMQDWNDTREIVSQSNQDFQLYQVQVPEPSIIPTQLGPTVDPLSFFQIPSSLPGELPLPKTFASAERSFARRLIRRSLEAAVNLLTSSYSTEEDINRFCRFTFCYAKRDRMIECLKGLIARNANESLEVWHMPVWHVGDSGLHFPRVGIDATTEPPVNWADVGPVGPTFAYDPEIHKWDGLENARLLEELGVDGEWFDSNDVEQYLQTKGVYLTGQSSIVEITELDDAPDLVAGTTTAPTTAASPSMTHSSLGGPQSPRNDFVPTNAVIYGNDGELCSPNPYSYSDTIPDTAADIEMDMNAILAQSLSNPAASKSTNAMFDPDFSSNLYYPQAYQLQPSQSQFQAQFQSQSQPQYQEPQAEEESYFTLKTRKYVDVELLINSIVPQSVCLGRTPGFRRKVVDEALRDAIVETMG